MAVWKACLLVLNYMYQEWVGHTHLGLFCCTDCELCTYEPNAWLGMSLLGQVCCNRFFFIASIWVCMGERSPSHCILCDAGATVGKMPCLAISAAVTSYGRQMIECTRSWVQQEFCIAKGFKHDCEVIYGDTDSVMVNFKVRVCILGCVDCWSTVASIPDVLTGKACC